jgi:hypothetical protein
MQFIVKNTRFSNLQSFSFICSGATGSQKEHFMDYITANKQLGLPPLWLDEGSPNCLEVFFKLTELKEAIKKRDERNDVSKVCRWTVDTKTNMRNALR